MSRWQISKKCPFMIPACTDICWTSFRNGNIQKYGMFQNLVIYAHMWLTVKSSLASIKRNKDEVYDGTQFKIYYVLVLVIIKPEIVVLFKFYVRLWVQTLREREFKMPSNDDCANRICTNCLWTFTYFECSQRNPLRLSGQIKGGFLVRSSKTLHE